MEFNGVAEGS